MKFKFILKGGLVIVASTVKIIVNPGTAGIRCRDIEEIWTGSVHLYTQDEIDFSICDIVRVDISDSDAGDEGGREWKKMVTTDQTIPFSYKYWEEILNKLKVCAA